MGASGVETPLVISGLTSETMYTFMVSASDASGNPAANNAITVMATTGVDSSTDCAGFSAESLEGIFSAIKPEDPSADLIIFLMANAMNTVPVQHEAGANSVNQFCRYHSSSLNEV